MTTSRRFLVLHGWQNHRPEGHWQWQLVEGLRAVGEQVLYPQLPQPDRPSLEAWSALLREEWRQLGSGERVVVAHSLSVLLWLHAAPELEPGGSSVRVLLVAPPSPLVLLAHPEVVEFGAVTFEAEVVRRRGVLRVVHGDDDPYCPQGAVEAYAGLRLRSDEVDTIGRGGHLDPDAGYGLWPSAMQWCLDSSVRLRAVSSTA